MGKTIEERREEVENCSADFFGEELRSCMLKHGKEAENSIIRKGAARFTYKVNREYLAKWLSGKLKISVKDIDDIMGTVNIINIEKVNENLELEIKAWHNRGINLKIKEVQGDIGLFYEFD